MNHLIVMVLVIVSCANAVLAQRQSSIEPASIYHQGGVTIVSPNQPGWVLLQSSKSETVFEKRGEDEIVTANVKTIKTKIDNDKELMISLETLKKEELSKLKRDSIHFNYVRFKGSRCVQYDGIFKVDGASTPKFEYFNLKGYLCRLPESKDLAVQIEFSNHSNLRGFSENLLSLSNEFFERILFGRYSSS